MTDQSTENQNVQRTVYFSFQIAETAVHLNYVWKDG